MDYNTEQNPFRSTQTENNGDIHHEPVSLKNFRRFKCLSLRGWGLVARELRATHNLEEQLKVIDIKQIT
jgi:hypothetical protein